MKMKLIVLSGLMIGGILYGQSEIKYHNKALLKILQRNEIESFDLLAEIIVPDPLKKKHRIEGKFFEIHSNVSQFRFIYAGRVNSCRAGGCSLSVSIPKEGESEYFDYFILFDKEKSVQVVKVFNYQATHGYEITAKGWLKQFMGYNGTKPLQVDKNIDAISGATISVYAITLDIEMKTKLLNELVP